MGQAHTKPPIGACRKRAGVTLAAPRGCLLEEGVFAWRAGGPWSLSVKG